jgi:hypothetical protein
VLGIIEHEAVSGPRQNDGRLPCAGAEEEDRTLSRNGTAAEIANFLTEALILGP